MSADMVDIVDETHDRDGAIVDPPKKDDMGIEGDADFEPRNGIEFESHEAAYSFYQDYAKSMGFTTSIKNSRRSKKSKEFIDAKFACSRYGVTPESDGGSSRRPSVKKTDCKASMHVKRRKDGKWQSMDEGTERIQTRVQRYNDLCKRAIELGEEGSVSEDRYNIAFRALVESLKNCVDVNNRNAAESSGNALCLREIEEEHQRSLAINTSKKKPANRKRKVQSEPEAMTVEPQDSLQQMDNLSSDGITLNGYYGTQQNVQGLLQLNLMEPPHDGYYVNQQSMQGLGQLNSIAPNHDGFFGAQQGMHGLGHLDFRPQSNFSYSLQDMPNLRSTQLHTDAKRHA
ncbi:Protein FAR-RED IMPAIRED RESPONSE 1 [Camellia lanceoleosa]|nr:Protein FAR-RED IMPAIRED RESPONSE 1 [Camellia lanceoleosa]